MLGASGFFSKHHAFYCFYYNKASKFYFSIINSIKDDAKFKNEVQAIDNINEMNVKSREAERCLVLTHGMNNKGSQLS